jgi:hypothetical protein
MGDQQLANPGAAFGQSASGPCETVDVVMSTSCAVGDVVALHTVQGVGIKSLAATARGIQFGIAQKAAASGGVCTVIVGGYAVANKGTAAILTGDVVVQDNTVSGAVKALSAATAITTVADARGFIGTAAISASAAGTTVLLYVGKF